LLSKNGMAKDTFHNEVKSALEKDGWEITDDPLYIKVGKIPIQIDIGAEKLIGAERNGEKIAVEIKTFGRASFITALHEAVGKYIVYRTVLKYVKSDRVLYLALPDDTYAKFGQEPIVKSIFAEYDFKILLYEPTNQIITSWIN
jgi:XisH protein